MAFEPAGLVGYPGITGGVGLVESVLGELLPVFPDLVQGLFRMAVRHSPGHELVFELVQNGYLLLSHRLTQLVSLTLGETGKFLGEEHDLLLIDSDPVGVFQVFFHVRKVILNRFQSKLPVDEVRNIIHRAWPVEGVHSDEVLKTLRMKPLQVALHAGRLKLEHAVSVAAAVELVSGLVVYVNRLDVDVHSVTKLYVVQAFVDNSQGVETEEVHLQHSDILYVMTVVLAGPDQLSRLFLHRKADWNIVGETASADDGGASVLAYLTDASFKFQGVVQHSLDLIGSICQKILELGNQTITVLEGNLDIRVLHSLLEPMSVLLIRLEARLQLVQLGVEGIFLLDFFAEAVRDKAGEPVGLIEGQVSHPRDILDGSLRLHGAEGDHPRHMILSIGLIDIFVGESKVLEVHVDIRHRDSVRVEETLEQELVLDRVQIGDPKAVSHRRSSG